MFYDAKKGHYQGTGSSRRRAPLLYDSRHAAPCSRYEHERPQACGDALRDTYLRLSSTSHLPSVGRVVTSRSHAHPLHCGTAASAPVTISPMPHKTERGLRSLQPVLSVTEVRGYVPRHPLITLLAWEEKCDGLVLRHRYLQPPLTPPYQYESRPYISLRAPTLPPLPAMFHTSDLNPTARLIPP